MLMDDMCTAEKTTLEFTRTAVLFFTMLWKTNDQVGLNRNGFQLEAKQGRSNGPSRKKVDRPEETGWEDKGGYLVFS